MRGGRGGMHSGGAEPDMTARPGSGPRTVRQIAAFFLPYRTRLLVISGLIVLTVSIGVVNPILLKLVIDNLLGPQDIGLLYLQCALMIVLPIISSGIGVGQSYLSNVVGQRVMDDLRLALYTHLQWMPLRFFTETRTGEIQSRIGNDVNGVQSVVTDTAASLLANFATVATTVIAMIVLDWRLTILSLGMLPVFAYITFRVGKVRREVSGATQRSMAEVSAITEESLSVSGILLSKTFGQQRASIERFRRESRRLGDLQIRQQMIGRWFFAMIGTFFSIAPAFVYLLAGSLIIGGDTHVSVGTIVAFTTLQSRLFFPMGQLLSVQVEIQGALALFDRIFEYLEMPHEITDAPDARVLQTGSMSGDLRFRRGLLPLSAQPQPRPPARRSPSWPRRPVARCTCRSSPSRCTTSTSRRARASSWRWSALPDRGRRPPRTSSRGCTTSSPERWRSTVTTSGASASSRWARSSASSRRRPTCSIPASSSTCATPGPRPPWRRSRRPRVQRRFTTGSCSCPRATTRWSGSGATSSRAARSSASRSRGCCSRIHAS